MKIGKIDVTKILLICEFGKKLILAKMVRHLNLPKNKAFQL